MRLQCNSLFPHSIHHCTFPFLILAISTPFFISSKNNETNGYHGTDNSAALFHSECKNGLFRSAEVVVVVELRSETVLEPSTFFKHRILDREFEVA